MENEQIVFQRISSGLSPKELRKHVAKFGHSEPLAYNFEIKDKDGNELAKYNLPNIPYLKELGHSNKDIEDYEKEINV